MTGQLRLSQFGHVAERLQRPGAALAAVRQAEHSFFRVETRVRLGPRLPRLGQERLRHGLRLEFRHHRIGDRARLGFQPRPPIRLDGRDRRQLLALAGTVECQAGEAIEERAVFVPHHHDAIPPAVESIIERRRVTPHEIGIGVVDEHAVGVADDAVWHEKPAVGDGPAIVLAANPREHPVIVAEAHRPCGGTHRRSANRPG